MGPSLTPEQRAALEGILASNPVPETWPATVRGWDASARRAAELMLRLSGSDGSDADRRDLDLALSNQPWSWVPRGPDAPFRRWTDDRVPANEVDRRHRRQKSYAEKVVGGWIRDPRIPPILEATRPALNAIADPLALVDQGIVTFVTARFLDASAAYPDGSEWPNPFEAAPADIVELGQQLGPVYVAALMVLAQALADAGVPLEPTDRAVLLVLSQLAFLDVDLTRPLKEILANLNIWPPGAVNREEARLGHVAIEASRHGQNARFQSDLTASARALTERLGPPAIRPPYAGGHRRRRPLHEHAVERRRAALAEVLRQFPDANAGGLRRTWDSGPATAGGLLRVKLGLQPHDPPPAETTLRNDLREIG